MADGRLIERIWFGDDAWSRAGRLALAPLEGVYRAVVKGRGAMFERALLPSYDTAVPAVSVGNITVGGTGKTPVAAWFATELAARGASPAIVLRGYGEDEPLVHRVLNPNVPVIVAADRVEGAARAYQAGADIVVLDDAFQHRRARRIADIVLVSADRWTGEARMLPAGPFREPLSALERASLVMVTRKAAAVEAAETVWDAVRVAAPEVPGAMVRLAPRVLREVDGEQRRPLDELAGREVRVLTAIADPQAFVRQLEALGAHVSATTFGDHHHFNDGEIEAFTRALPSGAVPVCTLKDAVKLSGRWPRATGPLWYVSQHVIVERGAEVIECVLDDLIRARAIPSPSTGR